MEIEQYTVYLFLKDLFILLYECFVYMYVLAHHRGHGIPWWPQL